MLGLTEVRWVPVWLADLWRAGLWLWMVVLIGYYAQVALPAAKRGGWRSASRWGTAALAVFMFNGLVLTVGRLHERMVIEGTPVLTVAVFCAWRSARCLAAEHHLARPGYIRPRVKR